MSSTTSVPTPTNSPTSDTLVPVDSEDGSGDASSGDVISGDMSSGDISSGGPLECNFVNSTMYHFNLTIQPEVSDTFTVGKLFYKEDNTYLEALLLETYSYGDEFIHYRVNYSSVDGFVLQVFTSGDLPFGPISAYLFLAVTPPEGSSGMCQDEEVAVFLTLFFPTMPPVCSTLSYVVTADQFDSISETLQQLDCNTTHPSGIEYFIEAADGTPTDVSVYQNEFLPVLAEYFETGMHELVVTACNRASADCVEMPVSVVLTVRPHPHRLFPYGHSYGQHAIEYADDYATSVYITNGLPFWTRYYSRVYVS